MSLRPPASAPPQVHGGTTADAVACMKLEELRAQSRAIGERMYFAGPGAKRPRKVEALPDSNPAKKKLKKNMSAYVSRFAAKEYEGLLAKTVSESERELAKAWSLRDDTQRDNLIMREQVARLQAQVAKHGSGKDGSGGPPASAPAEAPPSVWRTSALSLPVPERQLPDPPVVPAGAFTGHGRMARRDSAGNDANYSHSSSDSEDENPGSSAAVIAPKTQPTVEYKRDKGVVLATPPLALPHLSPVLPPLGKAKEPDRGPQWKGNNSSPGNSSAPVGKEKNDKATLGVSVAGGTGVAQTDSSPDEDQTGTSVDSPGDTCITSADRAGPPRKSFKTRQRFHAEFERKLPGEGAATRSDATMSSGLQAPSTVVAPESSATGSPSGMPSSARTTGYATGAKGTSASSARGGQPGTSQEAGFVQVADAGKPEAAVGIPAKGANSSVPGAAGKPPADSGLERPNRALPSDPKFRSPEDAATGTANDPAAVTASRRDSKAVSSLKIEKMKAAGVPAEVAALMPESASEEFIAKVAEKGDELAAAAKAAAAKFAEENPNADADSSGCHAAEKAGMLIRACERVLPQPLMRWLAK